jgi:hypothetical protein
MANPQLKKVPGPGVYQVKDTIGEGQKYTMGARNSQSSALNTKNANPGPGTYVPVDVNNVSNKYSMKGKYKVGTQIVITPEGGHEKMTTGADFNTPGPGSYQAKAEIT